MTSKHLNSCEPHAQFFDNSAEEDEDAVSKELKIWAGMERSKQVQECRDMLRVANTAGPDDRNQNAPPKEARLS